MGIMTGDKPTVLIAEDEEINRTILREILKAKYRILEAENGQQAVYCLKAEKTNTSLIILDIHMPEVDGFGVMKYLEEEGLNKKIPVVITTADQDPNILIEGKKNKIVEIFYKPFRASDVSKTVDDLIEICNYEDNLDEIIAEKSVYLTNQYEAVRKAKSLLFTRWDENIKTFIFNLLPESREHILRIYSYTEILCKELAKTHPQYGITKNSARLIADASLLHDLGEVIIPNSIITGKSGDALDRAIKQVKKRPQAGAELINLIFANSGHQVERKYAYDICRYMYETCDGKGYPAGLKGGEIPICAQVVSVVHRYDELRFQKDGNVKEHEGIMDYFLDTAGERYNPVLLSTFENVSDEIKNVNIKSVNVKEISNG